MSVVALSEIVARIRREPAPIVLARGRARPGESVFRPYEQLSAEEAAVAGEQQQPRARRRQDLWDREPDPASFPVAWCETHDER